MAGDIFFTDSRVWLSNSAGFCDVMKRAVAKCETPLIAKEFAHAEEMRCLGINLVKDTSLQAVLIEKIIAVANDIIRETNAGKIRWDVIHAKRLLQLAEQHLIKLNSSNDCRGPK